MKFTWHSRTLGFLLICASLPSLGEKMSSQLSKDIQWTVSLSYGQDYEDPDNKIPVLIMSSQYKNISKDRIYRLSFWNNFEDLSSISPQTAYKTFATNRGLGMPSPPRKEQAVELKPGTMHTEKRWFWAQETLPWTNSDQGLGYRVAAAQKIEVQFCKSFINDSDVFQNHLGLKDLQFDSGKLCTATLKWDFKIYSPEETDEAVIPEKKRLNNREAFASFYKALKQWDPKDFPLIGGLVPRADAAQVWLKTQRNIEGQEILEAKNAGNPLRISLVTRNSPAFGEIATAHKAGGDSLILLRKENKADHYWAIEFLNLLSGGYLVLVDANNGEIAAIINHPEG
jgi:hypothetical protein